jgi:peroxiredoxin
MVETGASLPDVSAKDDRGAEVKLKDVKRPLVLWFYPKADTPG